MDRDTIDEIKRHFGIFAEQLRGDVRAVADGQDGLREGLVALRGEVAREFDETRGLLRLSYAELDRRVRTRESELAELESRVRRVEGLLQS